MKKDEILKQRLTELKPLAMCLQAAIELFGREKARELAKLALAKYAEDRFVKEFEDVSMDKRWSIFKNGVIKYADGVQYKIEKQEENLVKLKYLWCSFLEVFRKYGLEDFVPLYCETDYTTCRKIHPRIKMTRTKTLVESDHCDHCWVYTPE